MCKTKRMFSEEHKRNLSIALKGRKTWNKGVVGAFSKESRLKMSQSHIGHTPWNKGTKGIMKGWCKGKNNLKICGEKHYNWKGGITQEAMKIRNSLEIKQWRKHVFERDKYTCVVCGKVGGELNAHHIKGFAKYPELMFEINNGITMCRDCHFMGHKGAKKGEFNVNGFRASAAFGATD